MSKPKAILFDIGGVCVISPMQAIQDYEIANGIPKDYVNFAISQTSPNGAWHKLERGEIKMDDSFFAQFKADLHQQHIWERYHSHFKNRRRQPTLAEAAKANASQLGDPVSLKAETSSRVPTPGEAGAAPSVSLATTARSSGGSALKESYQKNLLGDPTSLKNEGSASEPVGKEDQATGYGKGGESDGARGVGRSGSSGSGSSGLSSLQQSYKKNMLGDPTSLKNEGSDSDPLPDQQDTGYSKDEPYPSMTSHTRSLVPSQSSRPSPGEGNSLKQSYKKNMLGDPTSLKNEGSDSEPLSNQQDTGYSKDDSSSVPHSTQHTRSLVAGRPSSASPKPSSQSSSSGGGNSLKQSYQKNMLGDPTSLKNEGSSSEPLPSQQNTGYSKDSSNSLPHSSPHSRSLSAGSLSKSSGSNNGNSLQQSYKKNMLGDPTSLKNEGSSSEPTSSQQDTGYSKDNSTSLPHSSPHSRSLSGYSSSSSQSSTSNNGNSLQQSYKKNMLGDPTSLKNEGSSSSPLPSSDDTGYSKPASSSSIPPIPSMDTTALFWEMMRVSREPDPFMFPALKNLRNSQQFVVGALSNTVIFPDDHPYSKVQPDDPTDVRSHFDIFVSSAHVGLRKPDPAIYKLAVDELDKFSRKKGGSAVTAADVVFLDDIGTNLKAAREAGLRTIRVNLGRVSEAVAELEGVTGLKLAGDKAKL